MINPFDKEANPYCFSGYQYALDIISGKIVSGKYLIGACKRMIRLYHDPRYEFKADKAERFLKLAQRFEHIHGEWKTPNITFEPWQNFLFMFLIGLYSKETGYRLFRNAYIEIARGNAKSVLASILVLYFLALDNPKGNEISVAATKTEQARIVLDTARAMAKKCEKYLKATGVEVLAHRIVHAQSNSFARALSSDDKSLDGLRDILDVIDELHAVDRALYDVIVSGLAKRRDSLLFCISTAGFDIDGIGYSQSYYAKRVSLGEVEDDTFFALVYTLDEGDDIFNEKNWIKANPNYGVSVDPLALRSRANKAKVTPSDIPNFKTKHLNIWVSEAKAYFDVADWDKCEDKTIRIEDFKDQKCITSIDLSSRVDLTVIVSVFKKEGIYYVFDKSFLPQETANRTKNVLYDNSASQGYLELMPGSVIDFDVLEKYIRDLSFSHRMLSCHYDPWNAAQLAQNLEKDRISMVEFRMNTANLSSPTKFLDSLIRERKIRHVGSPLARWCIGNVTVKPDVAGNVFPRKNNERLKIDYAVALIMALAGWENQASESSVYEDRGILFF